MIPLIKKELRDLFTSPIAYVFICVFLFFSFWFYFADVFVIGEASLTRFFVVMPILYIIFLPAVSMGRWSEEKKSGTLEVLLTLPVSDFKLVLAKFFSCLIFLVITLFLTLPLVWVMSRLGDLDFGQVATSYLGLILMGACYLAYGLFVSSLTRNQIIAFLVSVVSFFAFFVLAEPATTTYLPVTLVPILQKVSFHYHFLSLMRGVVDLRDVIYYVSMLGLFLFLNVLSLQTRRT